MAHPTIPTNEYPNKASLLPFPIALPPVAAPITMPTTTEAPTIPSQVPELSYVQSNFISKV